MNVGVKHKVEIRAVRRRNEVMIKDTPIAVTGIECLSLDATMILSLIVHSHDVSAASMPLAKEQYRCVPM